MADCKNCIYEYCDKCMYADMMDIKECWHDDCPDADEICEHYKEYRPSVELCPHCDKPVLVEELCFGGSVMAQYEIRKKQYYQLHKSGDKE